MKASLKRFWLALTALILLTAFTACGGSESSIDAAPSGGAASSDSSSAPTGDGGLTIAMCLQEAYIDFYVPTRIGAMDAAQELGVNLVWQGPDNGDVSKLLSIIETQIDAGVDGLGICAANPASLMTAVEKARAKGIPVVIFNNTQEIEGFDGFVGIEPGLAGEAIGEQIEAILSGEHEWSEKMGIAPGSEPEGKIAYLLDIPGSYNVEGRVKGMQDTLSKYPGIEDVGTYDVTTQGMAKAKEVVQNIITAHPDIRVIASSAAGSTAAAGLVVQELGLEDQILVIGMDLLPQTLQLVKEGVIPMAVGQDPYNQGYIPVEEIVDNIRNGTPIPKVVSTEVEFVTIENVDEIIKRENDYLSAGTKLDQ